MRVSDAVGRLPAEYFRTPSSARVWDYWLGGKDNYEVDRAAGDAVIARYPDIVTVARESRALLIRVVRFLAGEAGVRQFLDIGTGLPTEQNTHEVAQSVAPESKIVYVDNDPIVLAHARALLASTTDAGVTGYLDADVRDPDTIIAGAREMLDLDEPVAVLLFGILGHAVESGERARSIVERLVAALAPGSYLVLADGADNGDPGHRAAAAARGYHLRTLDEFAACFSGLELVEPGLVPHNHWRPDGPTGGAVSSYVAVGRTS